MKGPELGKVPARPESVATTAHKKWGIHLLIPKNMKFEKLELDLFKPAEVNQSKNVKGGRQIELDTYVITSNRSGSDETRGDGIECDTLDVE